MTDNKQYPELPTHFMLVQETFHDEVYLYTSDQMRAYVDADREMRALQAAPAAWRHSRTYSVYEAAEQVPIADGDEWAEPLYLHPPEAQAAPAAVAEPVAWLHDDPQRYDVIHAEVKDLLVKSRDAAGYLHRPLDKSAHYTIPLYTAPAPAAQGDVLDAAKHCLEMGESFRALRRVVNLLLDARRNLGPEDHELRDRIDRLLRDDAAHAAQRETKV